MDDEELYAAAAGELRNGSYSEGLFAKAYAKAKGDPAKTKAEYIAMRVSQLKVDIRNEPKPEQKTANTPEVVDGGGFVGWLGTFKF